MRELQQNHIYFEGITVAHDHKEKQNMISVWFERMQQKIVTLWCQICLYK
jgi:hypothetical protein